MNASLTRGARLSAAFLLVLSACSPTVTPPNNSGTGPCTEGEKACREDGLYTCGSDGAFTQTKACGDCSGDPEPHCPDACDSGAPSVCDGDSIRKCANGTTTPCPMGTCVLSGTTPVCATKPGSTQCVVAASDGKTYALACAANGAIATDQACDERTGQCVSASFNCNQLASVPEGAVACDTASGQFYGRCEGGQPSLIACPSGTQCTADQTFNCYATHGGDACGGPAVCASGRFCTQSSASTPTCVTPAGILECNSTDILSVCSNANTGVACVNGAIWWWDNLTQWGGSCTNNTPVIPRDGMCIPGLANCAPGNACERKPFVDIAGFCRTPPRNAPAECTLTNATSTGNSCIYRWNSCRNGKQYSVSCQGQRVGSQILTTCTCAINGSSANTFADDDICDATQVSQIDAIVDEKCGWSVTTLETAINL